MEGSAYIRPTSFGIETITSIGSPTTTVPFLPPTTTGQAAGMGAVATNNGLSQGAIAGIVIGVLLGILLLFLFCACCLFKGLIDGILRLIGLELAITPDDVAVTMQGFLTSKLLGTCTINTTF